MFKTICNNKMRDNLYNENDGYRTVDREDDRSMDAGSSFFSGWTVDQV